MSLQDKTEAATPRRREEAREEGRVAKSMDVTSAAVLLVCLIILKVGGPYLLQGLADVFRDTYAGLNSTDLRLDSIPTLARSNMLRVGMLCLPVALGAAAVGIVSNVSQVGMKIAVKPLSPRMDRIDPLKGLMRLVSKQSGVELLKSVAKVAIVSYVVYAFLREEYPTMGRLAGMSLSTIGGEIGTMCWRLLVRACAAMLVIAILDYIYQRLSFEQSLKMTKQEVKEEYKRSEGDPQVKSRIRQRQREMARNRMMQEVPRADVVITNPTHIAVAIKYESERMSAPVVLAKGQRLVAEKIKAIAEANGIPIIENKPVARLLYKVAEIGHQVPEELYQAVAEILAFVYRMGQKAGKRYKVS
jgi:flagellar biosynthesis protein FlhB